MISVTEAKRLVNAHVKPLSPTLLPLNEAVGCVLTTDVFAPLDIPMAAQSAMDGYAFRFADWNGEALTVNHVIAAGDADNLALDEGEAVRIFTGAYLPADADTVVMQEKATLKEKRVTVEDTLIRRGSNVRLQGSEIKKGALALPRGHRLSGGSIGFLAMLGYCEVEVTPKPKVAVLVTGKELQQPGTAPEKGKVFEANSFMLQAALQEVGIGDVFINRVEDTVEATEAAISSAIAEVDILLITGGVSVGDFDFVLPATQKCGITQVFHKVAQKPGKPLFFGMQGAKPVFGLPGNPASVLTCFYQYVTLALRVMMQQELEAKSRHLMLTEAVKKNRGLTHFLKGTTKGNGVTPLPAQESFRLSSFAVADCLIELPEHEELIEAGTSVNVHLINH